MHFENGFLHRIESKLTRLNVLGFIKYTLALTLAVGLIFSIISVVLHYTVTESNLMERDPKSSFIELFAISVVLAPIVETFIFQHIPYFLYKKGVIFVPSLNGC
ncbi:hypothetical protein [Perlabentimonas gracilis]|uniref:hypothetical protein n=1 Tax=Perlabentimonas gracilis TaxID=2715279 RepID=UPI00140DBBEB|nr:hypothetical protein [Perlabentimonas gracilis]NHB67871.1 hypothetical protein [Perlabentimonas gracilis]